MTEVSICIPTYEGPDLVARALNSVFEQTYTDFEVIVSDDSRSTAIECAIKRWVGDARLRYVRNEKRLGSPENWNKAIAIAKGRFIKVLHHDDWFAGKQSLQQFVSLLESQPDAAFAFSGAYARDSAGNVLFQHAATEEQVAALRRDARCLFFGNFVGAPSATIFRREQDFRFDPALTWLVDVEAYIRILKGGRGFAFTTEPLVNITASGAHQVTRQVENDPALQFTENAYVYKRLDFGPIERLKCSKLFLRMAQRLDLDAVAAVQMKPMALGFPLEVRLSMALQKLRLALRQRLTGNASDQSTADAAAVGPKLSYSQCGEDVIIDFIFMWLERKEITYLDIGANHPTWLNNTYFFYQKGHQGVLVEPDPDLAAQLCATRPRDRCLQVAVGVDGRDTAKMYVMSSRTLNTLVSKQADEYESYGREKVEKVMDIPQRDINEILAAEFDGSPNLVSLDVEGLDLEILRKWDFTRFRPEVFCVETLTFTQDASERKLTEIVDFMRAQGYFTYADTYINTIFVSTESWKARPEANEAPRMLDRASRA